VAPVNKRQGEQPEQADLKCGPHGSASSTGLEAVMNNVIRTRTRMGTLSRWERALLRRGPGTAVVIVVALIAAALVTLLPIHIG
jgi:hypothetical protein